MRVREKNVLDKGHPGEEQGRCPKQLHILANKNIVLAVRSQ